eukprot:6194141-Pleurochrysis_carterae.AAC.2
MFQMLRLVQIRQEVQMKDTRRSGKATGGGDGEKGGRHAHAARVRARGACTRTRRVYYVPPKPRSLLLPAHPRAPSHSPTHSAAFFLE